jgi:prephenate dehydrogenase
MSVQVTIVGLGQIGTSIGLALADHREMVRRAGTIAGESGSPGRENGRPG